MMLKPRPRQLAAMPSSKTASQSGISGSSKLDFEADLCGKDGWVMVKRQRVIILVPPLPVAENSALQKSAPTPSQSEPRNITNSRQESPLNALDTGQQSPIDMAGAKSESCVETYPNIASVDEPVKPTALYPTSVSQVTRKPLRQPRRDFRMGSENTDRACIPKLQKILRTTPSSSKGVKWPRLMCSPSVLEGNAMLNQRLRASNLEKKLQKAGGLNRWLESIGVGGRFRRILRGKRMSKLQLANLTMEKLKQMGAVAVGPRRKLIHAIHCVHHP